MPGVDAAHQQRTSFINKAAVCIVNELHLRAQYYGRVRQGQPGPAQQRQKGAHCAIRADITWE